MADYSSYIEANRRRLREEASAPDRSPQALEAARELARRLGEELGASRVLLFGSLARGEFRPGSDIDLAIEGLDWKGLARAEALGDEIEDFEFSLLPLESASDALLRAIGLDGVALWPR